jgi:hypothetical protein
MKRKGIWLIIVVMSLSAIGVFLAMTNAKQPQELDLGFVYRVLVTNDVRISNLSITNRSGFHYLVEISNISGAAVTNSIVFPYRSVDIVSTNQGGGATDELLIMCRPEDVRTKSRLKRCFEQVGLMRIQSVAFVRKEESFFMRIRVSK